VLTEGTNTGLMGDFLNVAFAFPVVLFSVPLIAVIAFWLLVLFGGLGVDALDGDVDAGADATDLTGFAGFMAAIGLGGVPASVPLSLVIAVGWFAALAATSLTASFALTGAFLVARNVAIVLVALLCGWQVTRVLIKPLRRLIPPEDVPTRRHFVGRTCVIRTGRVTRDFGQAEVTGPDGSSSIIQVRQTGDEPMRAGSTALIFEYDADGEFFWVMPYHAELDPDRSAN